MELKKGQNLIEHHDEIFARPARTWFQTEKQKSSAEGEVQIVFKASSCTDRMQH
jgi:ATP-dependent RNA helicase DDX27